MKKSLKRAVWAVIYVACGSLASGQVPGAELRGRYAPGSSNETLLVRPGIEMAVTYGSHDVVCRLEILSGLTTQGEVDAVLDEVVPASVRGKQWRRGGVSFGGMSTTDFTDYEHVNISLSTRPPQPGAPEPIQVTVTFKDAACKP